MAWQTEIELRLVQVFAVFFQWVLPRWCFGHSPGVWTLVLWKTVVCVWCLMFNSSLRLRCLIVYLQVTSHRVLMVRTICRLHCQMRSFWQLSLICWSLIFAVSLKFAADLTPSLTIQKFGLSAVFVIYENNWPCFCACFFAFVIWCSFFSALTLLVKWQEGHRASAH